MLSLLILVSGATTTVRQHICHPNLGALITPRTGANIDIIERVPFAIDNDCFNGFNEAKFTKRLVELSAFRPLFVSAPDVVADADKTSDLFSEWFIRINRLGFKVAYVLQDGFSDRHRESADMADALFIGGSTEFKLSYFVRDVVEEYRHKWVHMGRVNSMKRIAYAHSIGCKSVDGTCYSRFPNTYIPKHLDFASKLGA